MWQPSASRRFSIAATTLVLSLAALTFQRASASSQARPPAGQGRRFTGQVLSASGALVVGGAVTNPGHPVVGATIHLVPVTAIDITTRMTASAIYAPPYPAEAYDEPLEDAIRLRGGEFPQATTDARGNFVVADVPDGRFFVHVTPGPNDVEHLPGGDRSRQSYPAAQLRAQSMTIKLSSAPSAAARFVGSSPCLACHKDKQHWQQTAHKLGWTVPGAPGKLQDFSRHPDYFDALQSFPAVDDYTRGTRLELADYDGGRGDDKFILRAFGDVRLPIQTIYADVYLWKNANGGKYFITMVNRLNTRDPNSPAHLEVKLLYGGAVHDQRYIVSVPPGLGDRQGWYTLLRYNMTGRDNRLHRERRVWQDYKFSMWWSPGGDTRYGTPDDVLTAPPVNTNAVQTMCAGCHLTGWERYQDRATGQYLVRAVNDPGGDMNIDDDPELDEINVGCESCHGPGSEHVANLGRSRFIVNPRYLSAERSSAVCGRCHDRRQGYGGPTIGYTQAVSEAGELARPGISRHELITKYTDPVKKGPTMQGPGREDNIWPDDVHSDKPHQQYADFLKSKMYRNDRLLVACPDCHDLHGGPYPRFLLHDPDDSSSPLCQRCHSVDVLSHMETKLNAKMKGQLTRCIDCHMPGTANTGGIAGDFGRMIRTPPYANAQEEENNAYWQGPLKSHVFDVPLKTNVAVDGVPPGRAMPIPYTAACGTCHMVNELPFK
ncbi:MAG TPA: cytochrome c3 family protein [Vicinamibacterales bacterium]|nr:cytochrome c3 family protein [Vicinamibacterales bacterium]